MTYIPEIVFIVLTALYSYVITHKISKKFYSFSNIIIALCAIAYARLAGLRFQDLGLGPSQMIQGLGVGIVISIPIIIGIITIASFKKVSPHFESIPRQDFSLKSFSYNVFFRVPFGTAFSEEVIFRAVLLSLLIANHVVWYAIIVSAVCFGLWHIFPTLHTTKSNDPLIQMMDDTRKQNAVAVLVSVLATTLAGVFFALIVVRYGSFTSTWIIHSTINGSALLSGYYLHWRRRHKTIEH